MRSPQAAWSHGPGLNVVVLGLSLSSSWGNGHATTYRVLLRAVAARGHRVLFLERDVPRFASARDLLRPPYCRLDFYTDVDALRSRHGAAVQSADVVIVGSRVPEGAVIAEWVLETARGVTAFYDLDTPVTLEQLAAGECEYLRPELIPRFDLYLSFTGGPTLTRLTQNYGATSAQPLYCGVDPASYKPTAVEEAWDCGYLGTYSGDRQPLLDELLLEPARRWPLGRFAVAGSSYPPELRWPRNVERVEHLPPTEHALFYGAQRFTLNLTRAAMIAAGYAPSVRLFEAAACGVPILSDGWDGLETFFEPGKEVLVVESGRDVLDILRRMRDAERTAIGRRARARVLAGHTAAHRAAQLEGYVRAHAGDHVRGVRT